MYNELRDDIDKNSIRLTVFVVTSSASLLASSFIFDSIPPNHLLLATIFLVCIVDFSIMLDLRDSRIARPLADLTFYTTTLMGALLASYFFNISLYNFIAEVFYRSWLHIAFLLTVFRIICPARMRWPALGFFSYSRTLRPSSIESLIFLCVFAGIAWLTPILVSQKIALAPAILGIAGLVLAKAKARKARLKLMRTAEDYSALKDAAAQLGAELAELRSTLMTRAKEQPHIRPFNRAEMLDSLLTARERALLGALTQINPMLLLELETLIFDASADSAATDVVEAANAPEIFARQLAANDDLADFNQQPVKH